MKRIAAVLIALGVLSLIAGCSSGPPTLVPTLAIPLTNTPVPSETPIPTWAGPPTVTPIPTDTPIPQAEVRRQATLRAGPGVDYPVAGRANFGDILIVYARCEGWFAITSDGSQWIIEGRVILNVPLDTIPDVCNPTPTPVSN